MSAAVESKTGGALQVWCARLTPALSGVLLPELIRLTAEYARPRHCWSTALSSRHSVIVDADGDARQVHWQTGVPGARGDEALPSGWWCALSAQPVGQYAGDRSTFAWIIQVDERPTTFAFAWGVADRDFATAPTDLRQCGGGVLADYSYGDTPLLETLRGPYSQSFDMPKPGLDSNERVVVGCTADVATEVLSFRVGVVDADGRIDLWKVRPPQHVPGLAKLHFWAGCRAGMKVTLLDN
jgi:hypothetical protein